MPLAGRLPLLPSGARELSDCLAILWDGDLLVFFNPAGAIYSCRKDDHAGVRLGAVTVVEQGLASMTAVAEALSLHRSTICRDARKFRESGVAGLVGKRRGPKRPHKLTASVLRQAQKLLDHGDSVRSTAVTVGVSERGVRHAIARGHLRSKSSPAAAAPKGEAVAPVSGPRDRSAEDQACDAGVAVKRTEDRAVASSGKLVEADPQFKPVEAVTGAGAMLALPALLQQGLLDVGLEVYGSLSNGFFGLRSVLITFALMALLRIKTPEQLTEHAPGELGLLLGLDRAPEVKTLRRKLQEMGARGLAQTFARRLAQRWTQATPDELGLLYIDGHVRPYHGRTRILPKHHVQQRGRPMPGTKDFHVNDRRADPLFFVTAEATEGLLDMLESTLLPQIREYVGPVRRVTIVFDREGWSPKRFAKWKTEKFDVLTYRKGPQARWQERFFQTVRGTVGGEKVEYHLADRVVTLSHGLRVREIRRMTDDGHQTVVITTNEVLSPLAIAHRMFSRWRQENFFRYMRHEFALDHLCTHQVEPADPKRLVMTPERRALAKKLQAAKATRAKLLDRLLDLKPGATIRVGKRTLGEDAFEALVQEQQVLVEELTRRVAALPKRAPIDTVLDPKQIVRLERERKILVDAVKLTAYRAESALARLVGPFFARHDEEARKFLKTIFRASADILPDHRGKRLLVRFHGLASPRATRALGELCDLVNEDAPLYPGTDLRLHFEAPRLQK